MRRLGSALVATFVLVAGASCDPRKFDDLAEKTWYRHVEHPSAITGDFGVRVGALARADGMVVVALAPRPGGAGGVAVYTYDSSGDITETVALQPPPPLLATDQVRDFADLGGGRMALGTQDNILVYADGARLTGATTVFQTPPAGVTGIGGRLAAGDVDGDGTTDLVSVSDNNMLTFIPSADGALARTCAVQDNGAGAAIVRSVRVGDWNGDGSVEVVIGLGNGGVGDGILVVNAAFFAAGVCVGDLATPALEAGVLFERLLAAGTDVASMVELADFDGTGMKDFVVADVTAAHVNVYVDATSPPVSLTPPAGDAQATFGASIAAGDFDGDGRDEILVGNPNTAADGTPDAGKVYVYKSGAAAPVAALWDGAPEENQLLGRALGTATLGGEPILLVGGNLELLVYFKVVAAGDDPRFDDQ